MSLKFRKVLSVIGVNYVLSVCFHITQKEYGHALLRDEELFCWMNGGRENVAKRIRDVGKIRMEDVILSAQQSTQKCVVSLFRVHSNNHIKFSVNSCVRMKFLHNALKNLAMFNYCVNIFLQK